MAAYILVNINKLLFLVFGYPTSILYQRNNHRLVYESMLDYLNSKSYSIPLCLRTDCGMDPQDVPHLFDCVAHPNDLSPVNLWDKPIETIRELSFLDPGNLN